jgi:hypothetical protein
MRHPKMKLRIQNKVCGEPAKPNKETRLMKILRLSEFKAYGVQMLAEFKCVWVEHLNPFNFELF